MPVDPRQCIDQRRKHNKDLFKIIIQGQECLDIEGKVKETVVYDDDDDDDNKALLSAPWERAAWVSTSAVSLPLPQLAFWGTLETDAEKSFS